MSEHPHLSIGEVLSLLQDEFPDMTISKIRFLESQGLLDPERTPSGYRKFYEQDLLRLRWILTQQRDNFLPLKVIKDRLEGGFEPGAGPPPAGAGNGTAEGLDEPTPASPANPAADEVGRAVPSPSPAAAGGGGPARGGERGEPAPRNGTAASAGVGRPAGATEPGGVTGRRPPAATGPPDDPPGSSPLRTGPPPSSGGAGARTAQPASGDRGGAAPATGWSPAMAGGGAQPGDVTGVSLSLGELAAASGCDVHELRELERFGIVMGQKLGPDVVYGDDALRAAQLAARFRRHGIEARHLRQYRMGADKEVALFEQVIAPLLRQRDRSAGGRAGDTLSELAELGEALHRVLVHRGLRDYLGGD